jgi:RHS repeat-associated protein
VGKTYIDGKEVVSQAAAARVFKPDDFVFLRKKDLPGVAPYRNDSGSIDNPAGSTFHSGTDVATAESALMNGWHAPQVSKGGVVTLVRDGPATFTGNWGKQVWIEGHKTVRHETEVGTTSIWASFGAVRTAMSNTWDIAKELDGDLASEIASEFGDEVLASLKDLFTWETLGGLAVDGGMALATAALTAAAPVTAGGSGAGALMTGAATGVRVGQRVEAGVQTAAALKEELGGLIADLTRPDLSQQEKRDMAKRAAGILARSTVGVGISIITKKSRPAKKRENSTTNVQTSQKPEGHSTKCACATENPVILATGEKTLTQTDFSLGGPIPVGWLRHYRSGDARTDGWFGQGWSHPLATELWLQADQLLYHDGQGRAVRLPGLEEGEEHFEAYERFTVRRTHADAWQLVHTDGRIHHFTRQAAGQWRLPLVALSDRNDNRIQLHFDQSAFGPGFRPFGTPPRPGRIADSAGRWFRLDWSPQGQLEAVHALHAGGEETLLARYHYAPDAQDPRGELAPPNLVAHTSAAGRVRRFEWSRHLLVGYTLADGARHHNEYDTLSPQGRVTVSRNLDSGAAHQFTYERHRTWMHDALGRTMGFAFDERRDIVAVRDALGHVSRTPFDANGHPEAAVDALGRETRTVFDRRGNLTLHLDAAGHATRIDYGTEGGAKDRPVRVTDALGHTWTHEYDARGNRIRSTDPLGRSTATEYDARGLPVALTDAAGRTRRLQWDASAQLVAYTDCSGRTSRYAYDALGHLAASVDALGHTTRYRHDAQGRLREVTEPTGATHRYEWGGEGQLLAYTDPLGGTTRYRYHGSGQPAERTDARGGVLRYHYDLGERLVALTNENGAHTRFLYDAADHLTDEIGFDGRWQRYVYNAAGELTHVIEAGGSDAGPGKVTHLERDALGRLLTKRSHGHGTVEESSYRYDALGRLTQANNGAAHLAFAYDPVGQLLSETQTLIGQGQGGTGVGRSLPGHPASNDLVRTLAHAYDPLGNRIRTALPDGRTLNWLLYGSGHLHQINIAPADDGGAAEVITDIERDALHRETERSQGAATSHYGWDPAGRLVRHRASLRGNGNGNVAPVGSGAPVASGALIERAYAYDATGQLVTRADSLRGRQDFRYDPTGRILAALPGQGSSLTRELFAFDPAGNLLDASEAQMQRQQPGQAMPPGLGVVGDNRLRFYQDLHYEYDIHGNVTKRTRGNRKAGHHETIELRWNADHQLVESTTTRHGVTQVTRYAYDALGRRVAKSDRFGSTHYLWDGDLMVHSQRGGREALFIYEPDSFVPLATVQGTAEKQHIYWYHCDQIGAPLELTDAKGQIAWAVDYKVWGEAMLRAVPKAANGTNGASGERRRGHGPDDGTQRFSRETVSRTLSPPIIEQPFRLQGQQFDDETGLHYNRFRYYDSALGRFISEDPIGLNGGLNLFLYGASALGWLDPLGLNSRKRSEKPNQALRYCDCEKWKIERVDRVCEGHVPGVGRVKIMRDPKDGRWYSEDQTGHGGSAWKVFKGTEKNMTWEADLDEYGDIMSKHKGEAGKTIDTSKMKCKNV